MKQPIEKKVQGKKKKSLPPIPGGQKKEPEENKTTTPAETIADKKKKTLPPLPIPGNKKKKPEEKKTPTETIPHQSQKKQTHLLFPTPGEEEEETEKKEAGKGQYQLSKRDAEEIYERFLKGNISVTLPSKKNYRKIKQGGLFFLVPEEEEHQNFLQEDLGFTEGLRMTLLDLLETERNSELLKNPELIIKIGEWSKGVQLIQCLALKAEMEKDNKNTHLNLYNLSQILNCIEGQEQLEICALSLIAVLRPASISILIENLIRAELYEKADFTSADFSKGRPLFRGSLFITALWKQLRRLNSHKFVEERLKPFVNKLITYSKENRESLRQLSQEEIKFDPTRLTNTHKDFFRTLFIKLVGNLFVDELSHSVDYPDFSKIVCNSLYKTLQPKVNDDEQIANFTSTSFFVLRFLSGMLLDCINDMLSNNPTDTIEGLGSNNLETSESDFYRKILIATFITPLQVLANYDKTSKNTQLSAKSQKSIAKVFSPDNADPRKLDQFLEYYANLLRTFTKNLMKAPIEHENEDIEPQKTIAVEKEGIFLDQETNSTVGNRKPKFSIRLNKETVEVNFNRGKRNKTPHKHACQDQHTKLRENYEELMEENPGNQSGSRLGRIKQYSREKIKLQNPKIITKEGLDSFFNMIFNKTAWKDNKQFGQSDASNLEI